MKISIKNSEINIGATIFYAISLLFVMEIPYLNYVLPKWTTIQMFLQLIVFFLFVFRAIQKTKISKIQWAIWIFCGIYILSTVINGGNILGCFSETLNTITLSIMFEYGIKHNKKELITAACLYFSIIFLINFATIVLVPQGLYGTSNLLYSTRENWFLGYRNVHIVFIQSYIMWNSIRIIGKHKRIYKTIYLIYAWSAVSLLIADSQTSLIGVMISMILLPILQFRSNRINNIITYGIAYLAIWFSIVMFRIQDRFAEFITGMTGRSATFTGRTFIWDDTISFIKKNPIIGYGKEENTVRQLKAITVKAAHGHNQILEILYRTGIVGIIVYMYIYSLSIKKLYQYRENDNSKLLSSLVISSLIMCLTEYYSIVFIFPLLVVAYNIDRVTK